jgi:hypothetical protein
MNADVFAEWLRQRGYRVFRTPSSYWFEAQRFVLQSFPYHCTICPAEDELDNLLKRTPAICLRYSGPADSPHGRDSYHVICANPQYDENTLGKWARKNVRRGSRNCTINPIEFKYLAEHGHRLQLDTLARQGRAVNISKDEWRKLCVAASELSGFEAWGAFVGDELAASVITFQMDDCCYMLYQQCLSQFLQAHPNNALAFVVTQEMMRRPHISQVFYALESLDAPPSMDEFKFRMGYEARPVKQRVVFHPWIRPLVNQPTHQLARTMVSWRPTSELWRKLEGLMRFALAGG